MSTRNTLYASKETTRGENDLSIYFDYANGSYWMEVYGPVDPDAENAQMEYIYIKLPEDLREKLGYPKDGWERGNDRDLQSVR